METNLVDILKGYVTSDVISKASTMLNESESGVYKGVSAAIPTLLIGLVYKSNDSSTMQSVMNLINDTSLHSGDVLSNLPSLLVGYENTTALNTGSKLMALLFKNKQSDTSEVIARTSSIKESSAASLLGMAAPLVLSYFAKSGMTLNSLKSLLSSQKENILSAAPSGLNFGVGSTIHNDSRGKIHDVRKAETSSAKWLIPLLLVGAGLFALFFFSKGCNRKEVTPVVPTETVDTVAKKMDAAVNETQNALGNFFRFKLPNGIELNVPEFGIENRLNTWLTDKTKVVDKTTWFNFDRLLFDTGKATLRPESQEQLKNMAEILKAYPAVELKIGGYTDNVGDPTFNLKLSGDRAKSVKDEMIKMGIAKERLESEGYGEQFPVASNDTEEGKAKNRRIAVRVTKK